MKTRYKYQHTFVIKLAKTWTQKVMYDVPRHGGKAEAQCYLLDESGISPQYISTFNTW